MLIPAALIFFISGFAALVYAVCAIGAVPLAFFVRRSAHVPPRMADALAGPADHAAPPAAFSLARWMWLYAFAGFVALSFEILWFRLLGVMLKSTSVTFGTLLAQYLFWLGLGSAIGSVVAGRFQRPAAVFLWTQAAAGVYAGVVVAVLVRWLPEAGSLASLYEYFSSFEPTGQPLRRYFGLSAIVIGPATLLMGLSFPFLQRAVQTDLAYLGRRVGALLMANIAGSTAGTLVTGWLLLATLGTAGTLRLLVALSGVFAVLAVRSGSSRVGISRAMHGAGPRGVIVAEDGSGVSLLKGRTGDFSGGAVVFVNGLGQSWLPYGGIHTELGALPAMIHPAPRDAAVIGLGSGDTLFAIAGRRELERITSIEIVRPQIDTLRALLPLFPYPALEAWLGDRRIEHVFDDGRAYIRDGGTRFDILEADALRPTSAYAGNLYSDAYFRLLRDHLKPYGLAVTWVPTARVRRTLLAVFPHAIGFGDLLMGSNEPIPIDHDAIGRRLADPEVQGYYAQAGINIRELVESRLRSAIVYGLTDAERAQIADINTDLYPRDELSLK